MTTLRDDELPTLQREVQRLLGRCLLRLQQYEGLIKAIVAHHEIFGPPQALAEIQAARVAQAAHKTLGMLIDDLLGSYVVNDENKAPPEEEDEDKGTTSFSLRMQIGLSEEDFIQTKNNLKELVALRNNLVHHFIDEYDIGSPEGCRIAQNALLAAYSRIDQYLEQLREWAEDMERARHLALVFVRSNEFQDLVIHGIAPDGQVDWSVAGIVSSLRQAAETLAVDGWTAIAEAGKWITERYPEQLPAKYGCSSWRQVVHESRTFEIRYLDMNGKRAARYREKEKAATLH